MTRRLTEDEIPAKPVEIYDLDQPTGRYIKFELQPDGVVLATDMPADYTPEEDG